MRDMKIDHDKRRNWYGMTCTRCGAHSVMFFNKRDAVAWAEEHLSTKHQAA